MSYLTLYTIAVEIGKEQALKDYLQQTKILKRYKLEHVEPFTSRLGSVTIMVKFSSDEVDPKFMYRLKKDLKYVEKVTPTQVTYYPSKQSEAKRKRSRRFPFFR